MIDRRRFLAISTAAGAAALLAPGSAGANAYLGSYVARISNRDKFASDGYPLDTAAQIVRQDRANVHRFGRVDPEDQHDPWFGSSNARARLERMLQQGGAMNQATRRAVANANPVIQVDVYQQSVRVSILGY